MLHSPCQLRTSFSALAVTSAMSFGLPAKPLKSDGQVVSKMIAASTSSANTARIAPRSASSIAAIDTTIDRSSAVSSLSMGISVLVGCVFANPAYRTAMPFNFGPASTDEQQQAARDESEIQRPLGGAIPY